MNLALLNGPAINALDPAGLCKIAQVDFFSDDGKSRGISFVHFSVNRIVPQRMDTPRPSIDSSPGLKLRMPISLWAGTLWPLPLVFIGWWIVPGDNGFYLKLIGLLGMVLMPLVPTLVFLGERKEAAEKLRCADENAIQLKLQLDTVRYRTSRLREELQAADRQARLAHQLTLLGQFSAGFMHEFNNPLAIVAGRLEVLLEERKDDEQLCTDLQQMLSEARYMSNIARTLLQALRRERGAEAFDACPPKEVLENTAAALRPAAAQVGLGLIVEVGDTPRVDVPEHVIGEVVRALIVNAIDALKETEGGTIWVRLQTYRTAGSKVILRVEDNGPGVPENIVDHLFEPFVSQSGGRERLGLGLFLAASVLDMYDGRIRYETREGGGASFVLELPPARFTRGQPYHWFAGDDSE